MLRIEVLLASLALAVLAQGAPAQTVIADLRTGVADDGSLLPLGADDDNYIMFAGPAGTGSYPRPATVAGHWFSFLVQQISFTTSANGPPGTYTYLIHFTLDPGATLPRASGTVYFDDSLLMRLNGVVVTTNGNLFDLSDAALFVSGDNVLEFEVYNNSSLTRLEVDGSVTVHFPQTINVPADYPTIQGAIDATLDGDRVLVAPGTYYENIDFKGKPITLQSADGPATTTISGGGIASVVRFVTSEGPASILQGFTIRDGATGNSPNDAGGGVFAGAASPTIIGNIITANTADWGGGIATRASAARIVNNIIVANHSTNGGGLYVWDFTPDGSVPVVCNNTVLNNTASFLGGGIAVANAAPVIVNSIFRGNVGGGQIHDLNGAPLPANFCDVEGGYVGTGNIDADPDFVDDAGDYHLRPGSPCLDAGDASASGIPAQDFDGDARILGATADIGADERVPAPIVATVSPNRHRYGSSTTVLVTGSGFAMNGPLAVRFGLDPATNVLVLDDSNLQCDLPPSDPGLVEVGVGGSYGEGVLPAAFIFTPAITVEGDPTPGATITLHYLCTPSDAIFAIWGFPPTVALQTPPYKFDLCIWPYEVFFVLPPWPFDNFAIDVDIPDDASLIGVDVLAQALIGPKLWGKNKNGGWSDCETVQIR
jgi:hypothetical protein